MVAAGFKSDIGGRTTGLFTGHGQRMHFGMGAAGLNMPTFPHHRIALGQHTAHPRIGAGGVTAALGQTQRAGHKAGIQGGEGLSHQGDFCSLATASSNWRMSSKDR